MFRNRLALVVVAAAVPSPSKETQLNSQRRRLREERQPHALDQGANVVRRLPEVLLRLDAGNLLSGLPLSLRARKEALQRETLADESKVVLWRRQRLHRAKVVAAVTRVGHLLVHDVGSRRGELSDDVRLAHVCLAVRARLVVRKRLHHKSAVRRERSRVCVDGSDGVRQLVVLQNSLDEEGVGGGGNDDVAHAGLVGCLEQLGHSRRQAQTAHPFFDVLAGHAVRMQSLHHIIHVRRPRTLGAVRTHHVLQGLSSSLRVVPQRHHLDIRVLLHHSMVEVEHQQSPLLHCAHCVGWQREKERGTQ
eukprot:Rhum_TRINITY_DN13756_c0_g2::Rhum_TRINITY_DN13756_c0_g2_i1::g.63420::m.63420